MRKRSQLLLWTVLNLIGLATVAALLLWLWRRRRAPRPMPSRPVPLLPPDVQGLTQAEAEARFREGQDNAIFATPPRTLQDIWRENLYTLFNFSLVGLAIAQLILGQPLGALVSLGTIFLNIGLNIAQEMLARRRLRDVQQAGRPQATVIREGRVYSIDPARIVVGDALVVGPGDQVLVDGPMIGQGRIVVDETMLGRGRRVSKKAGDFLYAGSVCLDGRAVYEAQRLGDERRIAARLAEAPSARPEPTPLERIVERVLWVLLAFVALLTVLLFSVYFRLDQTLNVDVEPFTDAISVIFNIAPSSLYFMIVLTYAAGTADLARLGALVHRARSVESLAQATVVCFAQAGFLTGTHVEIRPLAPPEGREPVAESRLRQILGDFVRNTSLDNLATRAIAAAFEGTPRPVREEAPFLAVYGWSAVAFDDDDLRGVYVLAEPKVLEPYLRRVGEETVPSERGMADAGRQMLDKIASPLSRLFHRPANKGAGGKATPEAPPSPQEADRPPSEESAERKGFLGVLRDDQGRGLFGRLGGRLGRLLRRKREPSPEEETEQEPLQEIVLLFAYAPEPQPLHGADGQPRLPDGLLPLCELHYSEQVRPEAMETIRTFTQTGIGVKAFTYGDPERTVAILRRAGLEEVNGDEASLLRAITGPELAEMDDEARAQAAAEHAVFGRVTPDQMGDLVRSLRRQGELVVVVGDRVSDLPAMRQADLAIARQSSSQAALSAADIVLLGDSSDVLRRVLDKGQRIAHGLLDVLKLNLTQVSYLALLILALYLLSAGFPFKSGQVTVINLVTVALPAAGFSLWATAGVLPRQGLGRILARFVLPATLVLGTAAVLLYRAVLLRGGDQAYAQLNITHLLVLAGLGIVVLMAPPLRLGPGLRVRVGDMRFAALALILLILFAVATAVPLAQKHLAIGPLHHAADYAQVAAAALACIVVLRLIWTLLPVEQQRTAPPSAS